MKLLPGYSPGDVFILLVGVGLLLLAQLIDARWLR